MKDTKSINHLRFQVLTAVVMKIWILWEVTPCWLADIYLHFRGLWCFHIQGPAVFLGYWTLKMKVLWSFETSVTVYLSTQHEISEDFNLLYHLKFQFHVCKFLAENFPYYNIAFDILQHCCFCLFLMWLCQKIPASISLFKSQVYICYIFFVCLSLLLNKL